MTKIFTAPFAQTVKTANAVCTTAGTTTSDSPTNTSLLFTAGTEGVYITKVTAIPRGTVTATGLYLFVCKDSGGIKRLAYSETMSAQTVAATSGITRTEFSGISDATPLKLEAGDQLYCSIGVSLTNGIVFSAEYVSFVEDAAAAAPVWARNAEWPTNSVPATEKFSGLFAVYDNASNFVALSAAGNYTVNWGDGSGDTNVATGVQAERNISYASVSGNPVGTASAVACTFTDSGDVVNLTAHGWQDGQVVNFATIVTTTGITTFTKYYIVNKATNTFQVSTTIGGSAVALTTNGSGTVFVPLYKVATITVVANGGTLTNINLQKKHSQSGLSVHSAPWLDIAINGLNLTTLNISTASRTINLFDLEVFQLTGGAITDFTDMFNACYSLISIPLLNTTAGTNFSGMFANCFSLTSVPLLNTAAGTNFSGMFYSCYSLTSVSLLNTAAGTSLVNMFNGCTSLPSVPLLNTAAGTNFSGMFYNCPSLTSVPLLNTAAGTNFSNMFFSCYSLTSVPLLNTAAGTDFSYMFSYCYSLASVSLLNTAAGTNFSNMVNSCISLTSVPLLNTAAGTSFYAMFSECLSLAAVPLLNVTTSTDLSYMFDSCPSLAKGTLSGATVSISYVNCKLSAAELDEIYTNLGTAAGAQTIDVTGNYGVTGDTPTIATSKGWTVTG